MQLFSKGCLWLLGFFFFIVLQKCQELFILPFKVAQDPCSNYVCIYLKSMQELQRLRTTTNGTLMNTHF